jgi:hypothetical protein
VIRDRAANPTCCANWVCSFPNVVILDGLYCRASETMTITGVPQRLKLPGPPYRVVVEDWSCECLNKKIE